MHTTVLSAQQHTDLMEADTLLQGYIKGTFWIHTNTYIYNFDQNAIMHKHRHMHSHTYIPTPTCVNFNMHINLYMQTHINTYILNVRLPICLLGYL